MRIIGGNGIEEGRILKVIDFVFSDPKIVGDGPFAIEVGRVARIRDGHERNRDAPKPLNEPAEKLIRNEIAQSAPSPLKLFARTAPEHRDWLPNRAHLRPRSH